MLAANAWLLISLMSILLMLAVAAWLCRSTDAVAQTSGGANFTAVGGGLAVSGLFALAVTVLLPGLVHKHGFDGLIPFVGLTGGLFALATLIGPALARSGASTVPALVGLRFGRLAHGLILLVAITATSGLLIATLGVATSLAARLVGISTGPVALAASAAILALVLPGGMKSALGGSRLVAILAGLALLGGIATLCAVALANPVAPLAYGTALRDIGPAELALIETGSIDFGTFKPFLREFLTVDRLNWALLTLCLISAVAALPPLVQATGAFRPAMTRRGLAWAVTFVVMALVTVPALAALARLETYRAVLAGPTFSELPGWMQRGSQSGALRLHGTSLALVDTVSQDVASGAGSIDAISAAMSDRGSSSETLWQRLDPPVQEAVLELARKFHANPRLPLPDRWTSYVDTVVTAAAAAAGNMSGKPDLASIAIEPQDLLIALPAAAGLPDVVSSLMIAIVLSTAVALAAVLVATLASMLVRDGTAVVFREPGNTSEVVLMRIAAVILTLGFALTAAVVPIPADAVFVVSLTLAAAGLLPALVLTIWTPRANAWGLAAAVIAGLALGTYYLAGTAIYSVAFYEAWPSLSSAGPDAYLDYSEARDLWIAAEGDDRAAAYADLASRTTGSLWSPGLANWFGIAPAAAAVLAAPFALLIGLIISIVTPAPSSASREAFRRIHASGTPSSANP